MKALTQYDIPAGEIADVLTSRLEPIEARNDTRHEIPGGHYVAVRAERGVWLIVADLGKRGDRRC